MQFFIYNNLLQLKTSILLSRSHYLYTLLSNFVFVEFLIEFLKLNFNRGEESMRRTINILSLLFLSFVYSTDVFISLDGNNLNYTSDVEIGGFQFSHDGCVESASGGEAGSAGFTVSASSTVVLGFSFTGATLPTGSDLTLTTLGGDIAENCLSSFIFSSGSGQSLIVDWAEEELPVSSSCDDDVCLSLDGSNLMYSTDSSLGGFQFSHDGCVTGATGGEAASAGFTVSVSGSVVLGFSFSGATLPSGNNLILTTLDNGVTEDCLSSFIFSSSDGQSLSVGWIEEDNACDDLDADGLCDDIDDCIGSYDDCGVCNGDNNSCSGCTNIFGLNYNPLATIDTGCDFADHQVEAGMFYYEPSSLQIEPGESVQWNNVSGFHDVVSVSGPESFSLGAVSGPALIGSHVFNTVGVYEYICSIGNHEAQGMVGTITVGDGMYKWNI